MQFSIAKNVQFSVAIDIPPVLSGDRPISPVRKADGPCRQRDLRVQTNDAGRARNGTGTRRSCRWVWTSVPDRHAPEPMQRRDRYRKNGSPSAAEYQSVLTRMMPTIAMACAVELPATRAMNRAIVSS